VRFLHHCLLPVFVEPIGDGAYLEESYTKLKRRGGEKDADATRARGRRRELAKRLRPAASRRNRMKSRALEADHRLPKERPIAITDYALGFVASRSRAWNPATTVDTSTRRSRRSRKASSPRDIAVNAYLVRAGPRRAVRPNNRSGMAKVIFGARNTVALQAWWTCRDRPRTRLGYIREPVDCGIKANPRHEGFF